MPPTAARIAMNLVELGAVVGPSELLIPELVVALVGSSAVYVYFVGVAVILLLTSAPPSITLLEG